MVSGGVDSRCFLAFLSILFYLLIVSDAFDGLLDLVCVEDSPLMSVSGAFCSVAVSAGGLCV